MREVLLYATLTVSVVLAAVAWAQPASAPGSPPASHARPRQDAEQQRAQGFMSMWNPQVMIDRSVKQAATRYKLTPEQEQLARKMTTDGVNEFLDKHETEIRSLLREAIEARMASTPPSPEKVQEWAKRVAPLFEEGQKAILDGNREFRDCLSDEQKKVFDADQQVLQRQVTFARERLTSWTGGRFNPETDWFIGPRRPTVTRPSQPHIDRWDLYVRGFINRYKLDAAQTSQAMAILTDSKNRATEYYYSCKAEIEAANQRLTGLLADPGSKDESGKARKDQVAEARKQLEDLNRPIDKLYGEMQQRLNQIPTDEQRKAYDAEVQARRDRFRNRIHSTGQETAISATSQSQPAATRLVQLAGSRPAVDSASQPVRRQEPAVTRPVRIQRQAPGQPPSPAAASQP
jgi:hypothetical protein